VRILCILLKRMQNKERLNIVYQCLTFYMYSYRVFMYDHPDWGFSVLFPQLYGKWQGKTHKDEAQPELFLIFVLFYVFLCCSMYWLFCDVLCIVCVCMCTELLLPGGYPIAVKYIIYHIIYCFIYHIIPHIISYIISYSSMLSWEMKINIKT
jgi:hypothetical protein